MTSSKGRLLATRLVGPLTKDEASCLCFLLRSMPGASLLEATNTSSSKKNSNSSNERALAGQLLVIVLLSL